MADCLLPAGHSWYGCELHASIVIRLSSYCSKRLWCEQPIIASATFKSVFILVLMAISCGESAAFAGSTRSDRDIFIPITIALI